MTYQVTASEKVKDLPGTDNRGALVVYKLTLDGPGLCQCGCGKSAPVARYNNRAKGHIAGQHLRFAKGHYLRPQPTFAIDTETGCWDWLGVVLSDGYGRLGKKPAHRLVYERLRGVVPNGLELDHLCRNRACVNPDHLEPVTRRENVRRGLCTKLTAQAARAILASSEDDESLAERYGVTAQHVGRIRDGRHWGDVA